MRLLSLIEKTKKGKFRNTEVYRLYMPNGGEDGVLIGWRADWPESHHIEFRGPPYTQWTGDQGSDFERLHDALEGRHSTVLHTNDILDVLPTHPRYEVIKNAIENEQMPPATRGYAFEGRLLGPHQDKELNLMLAGEKPFSLIDTSRRSDEQQAQWWHAVATGRIIHAIGIDVKNKIDYFSLPGEEWRMEKAREIFQAVRDTDVMTDEHHTTLGQLLGYSDEAIRHFIGDRPSVREDDSETLKLPDLDVGDELMVGKFKNRNATIKGFDKDKHNQPIAKTDKGDQQIFKGRVKKLMNKVMDEAIRIGEPQTGLLYRWVEPRKVVSNMKTDSMYPGKWKHNIPGVGQVSGISLGYDPHRWNREDVTVQFVLNRAKLNAKKLIDIPGQEVYNYSTATMDKVGDAGFADDYEKAALDPKAEPDEAFYVGIIRPLSAALKMIQVKSYATPQLKKVVQAYAEMHGVKVKWDFVESASALKARSARLHEAQAQHPLINRRMVGYLRTLRSQTRCEAGHPTGKAGCSESSEYLEARFGWPRHCGTYLTVSLEPVGDHCWNFLEDGSIIDITADQFGESGYMGIKIVRPDDPEYYRYRSSWEEDWHPGIEADFPEDPLYTAGRDDWEHLTDLRKQYGREQHLTRELESAIPPDWQERIKNDMSRHWGNPKHFKKMWYDSQSHSKRYKNEWAGWDEEILKGKTLESVESAPAWKARFARLYEAPVRSMTVGDLDTPHSSFSPTDRAMLQSPRAQLIAKKRIKTAIPIDINIYAIPGGAPWQRNTDTLGAMPMQDYSDDTYSQVLFNQQLERWSGIMDPEYASEIVGQPIQVHNDSVNVLYLSNANKQNSVPLTPWMMMHRLGHALEDAARKGHFGSDASEAHDDLFGFYTRRGGYMYGATLRMVMTTKSARDQRLDDGETIPELMAQYLHSGHVRLTRPVSYEDTGDEIVPYKFKLGNGIVLPVKYEELEDEDNPMEAITRKLEGDEKAIEEHLQEIISSAIGQLVVAP